MIDLRVVWGRVRSRTTERGRRGEQKGAGAWYDMVWVGGRGTIVKVSINQSMYVMYLPSYTRRNLQ